MLIALYEMKPKPGREKDFEKAWAEVTDAICAVQGSVGSRLHQTETPGLYIAYAQWPSRSVYDAADGSRYSESQQASRERMKDAMESARTLHLMDVCDDRLRSDAMPSTG
jgi:quinol monooxygenase YgiN